MDVQKELELLFCLPLGANHCAVGNGCWVTLTCINIQQLIDKSRGLLAVV